MLKLTLQIQEDTKSDTCSVVLHTPKDLSKASNNEKMTAVNVQNALTKALKDLQNLEENKK